MPPVDPLDAFLESAPAVTPKAAAPKATAPKTVSKAVDPLDAFLESAPAAKPVAESLKWRPNADVPRLQALTQKYGSEFDVDSEFLLRQINRESGGDPTATSPRGAKGVAQFMRPTAREYGVDVNDVESSIKGQARYMRWLLDQANGDYAKAAAMYNFGIGNVQAGKPLPQETRDYVASLVPESVRERARPENIPQGPRGYGDNDFGNSLRAGLKNLKSSALAAAEVVGADTREANLRAQREAALLRERVDAPGSLAAAEGFGETAKYIGVKGLESAPGMAVTMLPGVGLAARGLMTGTKIGNKALNAATLAAYPQAVGEIANAEIEAGGDPSAYAAAAGVPAALLDRLGVETAILKGLPQTLGSSSRLARTAGGGILGATGEAVPEVGQEFLAQGGAVLADPTGERSLLDAKAREAYTEAAVVGGAIGSVPGALGGGLRGPREDPSGRVAGVKPPKAPIAPDEPTDLLDADRAAYPVVDNAIEGEWLGPARPTPLPSPRQPRLGGPAAPAELLGLPAPQAPSTLYVGPEGDVSNDIAVAGASTDTLANRAAGIVPPSVEPVRNWTGSPVPQQAVGAPESAPVPSVQEEAAAPKFKAELFAAFQAAGFKDPQPVLAFYRAQKANTPAEAAQAIRDEMKRPQNSKGTRYDKLEMAAVLVEDANGLTFDETTGRVVPVGAENAQPAPIAPAVAQPAASVEPAPTAGPVQPAGVTPVAGDAPKRQRVDRAPAQPVVAGGESVPAASAAAEPVAALTPEAPAATAPKPKAARPAKRPATPAEDAIRALESAPAAEPVAEAPKARAKPGRKPRGEEALTPAQLKAELEDQAAQTSRKEARSLFDENAEDMVDPVGDAVTYDSMPPELQDQWAESSRSVADHDRVVAQLYQARRKERLAKQLKLKAEDKGVYVKTTQEKANNLRDYIRAVESSFGGEVDRDVEIAEQELAKKGYLRAGSGNTLVPIVEGSNGSQWLTALLRDTKVPHYRELMQQLAKAARPLLREYKVTFGDPRDTEGNPVSGMIEHATKTITINKAAPTEEAVLHELLHAAADAGVLGNPDVKAELEALMAELKKEIPGTENAFENTREFLNYYFTSPAFRSVLEAVVPGKVESILNKVMRLAKRALAAFGLASEPITINDVELEARMQAVLRQVLGKPRPPTGPKGGISYRREDGRVAVPLTPAERQFFESVFSNAADRAELIEQVPSARLVDGALSLDPADRSGLEDYVADTWAAGKKEYGGEGAATLPSSFAYAGNRFIRKVQAATRPADDGSVSYKRLDKADMAAPNAPRPIREARRQADNVFKALLGRPTARALIDKSNRLIETLMTLTQLEESFGKELPALKRVNQLREQRDAFVNQLNEIAGELFVKLQVSSGDAKRYNEYVDLIYASTAEGFRLDRPIEHPGNQQALARGQAMSPKGRAELAAEIKAARAGAKTADEKKAVKEKFADLSRARKEAKIAKRAEQFEDMQADYEAWAAGIPEKDANLYTATFDHMEAMHKREYDLLVEQTMRAYDRSTSAPPNTPLYAVIQQINDLQRQLQGTASSTERGKLRQQIRETIARVTDPGVAKDLRERLSMLDDLRQSFDNSRNAYFPLMRFGDFLVVARSDKYQQLQKEIEAAKAKVEAETAASPVVKKLNELRAGLATLQQAPKEPGNPELIAALKKKIEVEEAKLVGSPVAQARLDLNQKEWEMRQMRASGDDYIMQAFDSEIAAEKAVDELNRQGLNAEKHIKGEWDRAMDGIGAQFVAKLKANTSSAADKEMAKEFNDLVMRMYLQSQPESSALKRRIQREGIAGYSRDLLKSYAESNRSHAFYASRLKFSDQNAEAMEELKDQAKKGGARLEDVYNTVRRGQLANMQLVDNPITDSLSRIGAFWYLAVTPAFLLLNLTQNFIVTLPTLGGRYGYGNAFNALAAGFRDTFSAYKSGLKQLNGRELLTFEPRFDETWLPSTADMTPEQIAMRRDEGRMIDTIQETGGINFTQTVEMADRRLVGDLSTRTGKVKDMLVWAERLGWWLPHHTEISNRGAAALASYRLAREGSKDFPAMDHDAATEYAKSIIRGTHGDYAESNKPELIRRINALPGGKLLTLFKSFQQMMLFGLAKNFRDGFMGADLSKAERAAARKALAGVFGMHALIAGSMGVPGFATMAWMVEAILPEGDDEPFDFDAEYRAFWADMVGERAGEVISRGVLRTLPIIGQLDIASRVSAADIFMPVRYQDDPKAEGRGELANFGLAALGPVAGIAANMADAAAGKGGDFLGTMALITPKFVADIARSAKAGTEGVTTRSGAPLYDPTFVEVFGQALGFRPARSAESGEMRGAALRLGTEIEARENEIRDAYIKATKEKDYKAQREAMAEARAFYRIHKDRGTAADLRESVKRRAQRDSEYRGARRQTESEFLESRTDFGLVE